MAKTTSKSLSEKDQRDLLEKLEQRFTKNMQRHKGIEWKKVVDQLKKNSAFLMTLHKMESTGGEPDIVLLTDKKEELFFVDCAAETPVGRRSLCYDRAGLESRKENRPVNSAMDLANEIGIEMLDEDQYRKLQSVGKFDTKTSSWLKTPAEIRKLGGAIFADFRFGRVFVYHNTAQSYYGSRAFRGFVKISHNIK
ncbi:MAG: DUF4256 domain-containing protein [Crocinitomicaceae bacterium]|nr:DUF4256 domain-containing protein [Crocinitomicaceae bacterium]MBK8927282.1 DUF4256 domain-containing protein [Crocinitomicaceae bacterium]